jgi:hypothetical protein
MSTRSNKKRPKADGTRSQRESREDGGLTGSSSGSKSKNGNKTGSDAGKSTASVGSKIVPASGGVKTAGHAGPTGGSAQYKQRGTPPGTSGSYTKASRVASSPQFENFTNTNNGITAAPVPATIGRSPAGESTSNRSTGSGGDASSVLTGQTPSLYNPEEKDPRREALEKKLQLQEYVRHELFPRWKFFTCPSQLVYDAQNGSIVLKICNSLNVSELGRMTWWERNKQTVVQILNMRRNEVTAYVKKRFIGK